MYLFIKKNSKRHILLFGLGIIMLLFAMPGMTYQTLQAATKQTECYELLKNGNLNTYDSWYFGKTNYIASIVNKDSYGGSGSLRLGISAGISNRLAHSTAYQHVLLPKDITSIEARYQRRSGSAGDGTDYREILILSDDFTTVLATVERDFSAGSDQWVEVTQDLTEQLRDQAGQEVIFYANVYNNGKSSQMWQYLDVVSLNVCTEHSSNAEPTATPDSVHQVQTPVETPQVTADPIEESDTEIQLGNDVTGFGSEFETSISINILNIPDGQSVGATTVELVYDWSSLKATGCQMAEMSLLICNIDEPGIIRIAAKSAQALTADSQIAEVKFTSLIQPIDQELMSHLPLDLSVVFFDDRLGNPLEVVTKPGEIILVCLRGDVNCDDSTNSVDSLTILQYAVEMKNASRKYPLVDPTTEIFVPACDVNGNSSCDAVDALFILQCELGFNNIFCPAQDDNLARSQQAVPNLELDSRPLQTEENIIRVESVPAGATGIITVPVATILRENSLSATTIDLKYDPTILKVVSCTENSSGEFNLAVCNPSQDNDGIGLDKIGFVAASIQGVTGEITMFTVAFEVLEEISETVAPELFRLQVRTFADKNGQGLGYIVEGVGPNQMYLPLIQK